MWVAPKSLANMQVLRQAISSQFSAFLFREGVFNRAGQGLTVYMRERTNEGELKGLMIHDSREENEIPSTILAKRGALIGNDDGYQVVVYDGSRQDYDPKTSNFRKLNFERYIIDLPDDGPVSTRWKEPDERTIIELLNPDLNIQRDVENLREFNIEIHRRIISPVLALSFSLLSCALLLLGPIDRRGQGWRITLAIVVVVALEGFYLATFNLARRYDWALLLMYALVLAPLLFSTFLMSEYGERIRRTLLYRRKAA